MCLTAFYCRPDPGRAGWRADIGGLLVILEELVRGPALATRCRMQCRRLSLAGQSGFGVPGRGYQQSIGMLLRAVRVAQTPPARA